MLSPHSQITIQLAMWYIRVQKRRENRWARALLSNHFQYTWPHQNHNAARERSGTMCECVLSFSLIKRRQMILAPSRTSRQMLTRKHQRPLITVNSNQWAALLSRWLSDRALPVFAYQLLCLFTSATSPFYYECLLCRSSSSSARSCSDLRHGNMPTHLETTEMKTNSIA